MFSYFFSLNVKTPFFQKHIWLVFDQNWCQFFSPLLTSGNWVFPITVLDNSVSVTNLEETSNWAIEVPLSFSIHGTVHSILLAQKKLKIPNQYASVIPNWTNLRNFHSWVLWEYYYLQMRKIIKIIHTLCNAQFKVYLFLHHSLRN